MNFKLSLFLILFLSGLLPANAFGESTNTDCIKREKAINMLLDPSSGINIDPSTSNLWCPYVDFGFGPGFEGLLPKGTIIDPAVLGSQPFPGKSIKLEKPSYFFWINDDRAGRFSHQTRFVILSYDCGGSSGPDIEESIQGWWPIITFTDGTSQTFYDADFNRVSDSPAGVTNTYGIILGVGVPSSALNPPPPPPAGSPAPPDPSAYGIIVKGSAGTDFDADRDRLCRDLTDVHGVPAGNIVKADNGGVASLDDLKAAIDSLCNLGADTCTKIFVQIVSHGTEGGIMLDGNEVSADSLCSRLEALGGKNVPICYNIDACFSGSLIDDDLWNAPPGSTVITSADSTHESWGSSIKFLLNGDTIVGSLFGDAISRCLRDSSADSNENGSVDECEALDWVIAQKPCYIWCGDTTNYYPAGAPDGTPSTTHNPGPQKKRIPALDIKILDGPNECREYHAPGDKCISLCSGQIFQLTVPSDAKDIHWVMNDKPLKDNEGQGKSNIKRKAPKVGKTNHYTVTYVYNGKRYSYSIKIVGRKWVEGQTESLTSTSDLIDFNFSVVNLSPNPFTQAFNVELYSKSFDRLDITMMDLTGKVLEQKVYTAAPGTNLIEMTFGTQLAQGLYLLQISNSKGQRIIQEISHQ